MDFRRMLSGMGRAFVAPEVLPRDLRCLLRRLAQQFDLGRCQHSRSGQCAEPPAEQGSRMCEREIPLSFFVISPTVLSDFITRPSQPLSGY